MQRVFVIVNIANINFIFPNIAAIFFILPEQFSRALAHRTHVPFFNVFALCYTQCHFVFRQRAQRLHLDCV